MTRPRQVIVPKNAKAAERLDYDLAKDCELHIYLVDDSDFLELFGMGFFRTINAEISGCFIDDFEDQGITSLSNLLIVKDICDRVAFRDNFLVSQINVKVDQAINSQTGLYFYF